MCNGSETWSHAALKDLRWRLLSNIFYTVINKRLQPPTSLAQLTTSLTSPPTSLTPPPTSVAPLTTSLASPPKIVAPPFTGVARLDQRGVSFGGNTSAAIGESKWQLLLLCSGILLSLPNH